MGKAFGKTSVVKAIGAFLCFNKLEFIEVYYVNAQSTASWFGD
jgi:hypothetical protein